jgi:hypothetical protein
MHCAWLPKHCFGVMSAMYPYARHKNLSYMNTKGCYMIWHNNVDLIMEHHKIKQAYNSSQTNKKGKGRMNNTDNKFTSSEGEDNDDVDNEEDEFDDEKDIDGEEEDID